MARKLQLEYEGVVYHVISRGHYRADVFGRDSAKVAFLKCLGEVAEKAAMDRPCVARDVQSLPSLSQDSAGESGGGSAMAAV